VPLQDTSGMRAFSHLGQSLRVSTFGQILDLEALSLPYKFPFPGIAETRFEDWWAPS